MPLPAGALRHRIVIEEMKDEPNSLGESVPVPTVKAVVWGRVDGLMAREFLQADRTKSTISYKVRIRALSWLTSKYRLRWQNRILNIQSVMPRGERMEEMELFASEEND